MSPSHRGWLRRSACSVALLMAVSLPLPASADWWQRGQDLLRGLGSPDKAVSALGEQDIADGLREALRVGGDNVLGRLGTPDGFNMDPVAHIPLPRRLAQVRDTLDRVGLGGGLKDLELRLNRAAEQAVPQARELLVTAISRMTLQDARNILEGPDDAATRYFEAQMRPDLTQRMRPLIDSALAEAGAVKQFEQLQRQVATMPWLPDLRADLTEHVVDGAGDALFHYLGQEEAAIRQNPARQTTDLLRRVFGG